MIKSVFLVLLLSGLSVLQAQEPVEKRLSKRDYNQTYLFDIKEGDTLVYEVNAGGQNYQFIVAMQQFDPYDEGIHFNWKMTNPVNRSGSIQISSDAMLYSRSYINRFAGGSQELDNESAVFLTTETYTDLMSGSSVISLDGIKEKFVKKYNSEVKYPVNVHGKTYLLNAFDISNEKTGAEQKTMIIQLYDKVPVILKMDIWFRIELKEIR